VILPEKRFEAATIDFETKNFRAARRYNFFKAESLLKNVNLKLFIL